MPNSLNDEIVGFHRQWWSNCQHTTNVDSLVHIKHVQYKICCVSYVHVGSKSQMDAAVVLQIGFAAWGSSTDTWDKVWTI